MATIAYYALLSREPLDVGFAEIRASAKWVDGPVNMLASADLLRVTRGDSGELSLRMIDCIREDIAADYVAAVLFCFDLDNVESAALAWEMILSVLSEECSFDVWNAAYPAQTIAKYAELRPLTILGALGYVMRPAEFDRLATRLPE